MKKDTLQVIILLVIVAVIIMLRFQTGETPIEQIVTTSKITTTTQGDKMTTIVFETSKGNFEVELDYKNAPISSKNFEDYVKEGYYDGLIFHRVIKAFMVQGGGFEEGMIQKNTKDPIKNEAGNGLTNDKYTLAMARTSVVDSATSQFFINVDNNVFLNHRDNTPQGYGYAVFGKIVSGFDTIDAIENVETTTAFGFQDVPKETVMINKAYIK